MDELGFHQATSVAELLAERGCAVEVITSALLVGQDLGLTLWHALGGAGHDRAPFEVRRVGDCLAPRRAHAAVIEGERAGAAL